MCQTNMHECTMCAKQMCTRLVSRGEQLGSTPSECFTCGDDSSRRTNVRVRCVPKKYALVGQVPSISNEYA